MYVFTPVESARIVAIPMIPIEPAKAVRKVLPFFVRRLFALSRSDVKNDIAAFFTFPTFLISSCSSTGTGSVSVPISPSRRFTIRVE